jgi:hypothetical protein
MKHQIKIDNSGVSLTGCYPSRSYDLVYSAVSRLTRGLLSSIQIDEASKADPRDPEPSAARLVPRRFSAGVVDSLGGGFFCLQCYKLVTNKD